MFLPIYHHGFPIKALCICSVCMIKQIIKSRGNGLSVRHFRNDRLYSSCFLFEHLFYFFS